MLFSRLGPVGFFSVGVPKTTQVTGSLGPGVELMYYSQRTQENGLRKRRVQPRPEETRLELPGILAWGHALPPPGCDR